MKKIFILIIAAFLIMTACSSKKTDVDADGLQHDGVVETGDIDKKPLPTLDNDNAGTSDIDEPVTTDGLSDDDTFVNDYNIAEDDSLPDEIQDIAEQDKDIAVDLDEILPDNDTAQDDVQIDEAQDEAADILADDDTADETALIDEDNADADNAVLADNDVTVLDTDAAVDSDTSTGDPDLFKDNDTAVSDEDIILDCDDHIDCTEEGLFNGKCTHLARHDQCQTGELCSMTDGCVTAKNWACIPCPTGKNDCVYQSDVCAPSHPGGSPVCMMSCSVSSDCPDGFTCTELFDEFDNSLGKGCTPDNLICCLDLDGDGAGTGKECSVADCDDTNKNIKPGAVEICNGKDDNCNGLSDEQLQSPSCGNQDGACFGARKICGGVLNWLECTDQQYSANNSAYEQIETLCDSIDNDCNGEVDEPYISELYQACFKGVGLCENTGYTVCATDKHSVECNAVPKSPAETPSEASCDNKDNNCDGHIDEPWDRAQGCSTKCKNDVCYDGFGVCRSSGLYVCTSDKSGTECTALPGLPTETPQEASCDNLDNNCDGMVDDPWQRTGGICNNALGCKDDICVVGIGACQNTGLLICNILQNDVDCSVTAGNPVSETCNNIDDDCDGTIDNGFAEKNQACVVGTGACQNTGINICRADGIGVQCNVAPGSAGVETCNNIDDDCDGTIDNGFPTKNQACFAGVGACKKAGVNICKADGTDVQCNAVAGSAGIETCNNIDDDCDGSTDNGFPTKGNACSVGTGACQKNGVLVCKGDGTGVECNVTAGASVTESCNNIDDDCDGNTDNGFPTKGLSCTVGTGACQKSGVLVCKSDGTGVECNVTPGSAGLETCNNIDDDCDGTIDNGFAAKNQVCVVGTGACQRTGVNICRADGTGVECNITAATGTTETCNGIDDDCDGTIDNGFPTKNQACFAGVGACRNAGVNICKADGTGVQCNAVAGTSTAETCNNIDDDCNGAIDNGFPTKGNSCSVGTGACQRNGVLVCNGAGTGVQCNVTAGTSAPESCNNIDDDCDGTIDNGFATKGNACTVGTGACQRNGVLVCNGAGTGVQCNVTAGTSVQETCNGIDDDCDGTVDNGFATKGQACTVGTGSCQRAGVNVCKGDGSGVQCNAVAGTSGIETCNGIDDDCDGTIDNGFPTKGQACTVGTGACQRTGVNVCNGAGTGVECNATPGAVGTESCNGIDDNCNGTIDDGLSSIAPTCINQTGVCAGSKKSCGGASGWRDCGPTEYSVNGTYENGTETICDGKDNDCDGSVDEGVSSYAPSCDNPVAPATPLKGVCVGARKTCGGASGWLACDASRYGLDYQVTEAKCDGLDNDCDGQIDEGFKNQTSGKYDKDTACGNCSTDCTAIYSKTHAFGVCNSVNTPVCEMRCNTDTFDLNLIPDDGCEFVLDKTGIYVSTADPLAVDDATCGLGPTGTGTGNHPCKTISAGITYNGIARAVATSRPNIYVADGLYQETVILSNGKSLYGGYKADTWERHLSSTLTIIRGNTTAYEPHKGTIIASAITSVTDVEGFVVYGQDATADKGNSYTFYITGSNENLRIKNNVIYGGTGGSGVNGNSGFPGTAGGSGTGRPADGSGYDSVYAGNSCGDDGCCDTGKNRQYTNNGINGSCSGANGGRGGGNTCSPVFNTPTSGTPGNNGQGTAGGAGGVEGYDMTLQYSDSGYYCTKAQISQPRHGANGVDGSSGAEGSAGLGSLNATGAISSGHWVGGSGNDGGSGNSGGGGGGGGAGGGANSITDYGDTLGGHGGGGGAGGCGATGAFKGEAAGGSFAVFIINSSAPILTGNTVFIGTGGTGGKGGNGGVGGNGGNGGDGGQVGTTTGTYCAGTGGKGGKGGRGGHGGGGGGGAGGVAFGITLSNVTGGPDYTTGNIFSGGTSGVGGSGGASLGNPGLAGIKGLKASVYDFGGVYCGNGTIDAGEACDNGTGNGKCSTCDLNCQIKAANTCGDGFTCGSEACDNGGDTFGCSSCSRIVPATADNNENAQFVSWTGVPATIQKGQTFSVTITFKNTGTVTWDQDGTPHNLGSQSPQDNGTWGFGRVPVVGSIAANGTMAFTFTATAPLTPGTYAFQWRMVHDGYRWFGEYTPNQAIVVAY